MNIKKDRLSRFSVDCDGTDIMKPRNMLEEKGFSSKTTFEPTHQEFNYLFQKNYWSIKFNRYLAIQKASEVVEHSFDEGEEPYPFVYSGGGASLDKKNENINVGASLVYSKYDFSKDMNEDDLGCHFYPVRVSSGSLSIDEVKKDQDYSAELKSTEELFYENVSFKNSPANDITGSVSFRFMDLENKKNSKNLKIEFHSFVVNEIYLEDEDDISQDWDMKMNGFILVSNFVHKNGNFSVENVDVLSLVEKGNKYVEVLSMMLEFKISSDGSIFMKFTLSSKVPKDNNNYKLVYKDYLNFTSIKKETAKTSSLVTSRQFWGVYGSCRFDGGVQKPLYSLKKIQGVTSFSFSHSRKELLEYILDEHDVKYDTLMHILIKERDVMGQVSYVLENYPLGKRKTSLSFGEHPIGTVVVFGGDEKFIPYNYLLCDGRELLIEEYPSLYETLSDKWGSASSSTYFKLPSITSSVTGLVQIMRVR